MFTHLLVRTGPRDLLRAGRRNRSHRLFVRRKLCVEALEDRQLLSVVPLGEEFEVATLDDSNSFP
ncbi:MAG: hypothetical protein IIA67_09300, partial [Planctomycetes bacterium]|nr:hypothetical protein [Planctomycetota bacterium]